MLCMRGLAMRWKHQINNKCHELIISQSEFPYSEDVLWLRAFYQWPNSSRKAKKTSPGMLKHNKNILLQNQSSRDQQLRSWWSIRLWCKVSSYKWNHDLSLIKEKSYLNIPETCLFSNGTFLFDGAHKWTPTIVKLKKKSKSKSKDLSINRKKKMEE